MSSDDASKIAGASLQTIFDAAPDPLVAWANGQVIACNALFSSALGGFPKDLVGQPLEQLADAEGLGLLSGAATASSPDDFEVALQHADEKPVPMRMRVRNIAWGEAKISVAFASALSEGEGDERRRLHAAHDEEVRRLRETSKFKTEILNTTAHELNTPLTPVRLQMHLLMSGALGAIPARQEKALAIINRNVERLAFLVNDILDVARLEGGSLEVNPAPTHLNNIVSDCLESFEETARRVGVALSVEGSTDLKVFVDGPRILQVLTNLVANALKFTDSGGQVTVRVAVEKEFVRVSIIDTGLGLEKAQINRLFAPFSRVHDTESSAIAGTGLGLFICKGIMEAHGSDIEVSSEGAGKGSQFSIVLPLTEETVAAAPAVASRVKRPVDPLAQRLRELI